MKIKTQIKLLRAFEIILYILILLSFSFLCFGQEHSNESQMEKHSSCKPTPNVNNTMRLDEKYIEDEAVDQINKKHYIKQEKNSTMGHWKQYEEALLSARFKIQTNN